MFTKSSTSSTTFHKPITATLSTSTAMVPYLRNLGSIVRNTVLPGVVSAEAEDALGGDEREALVDALIEAAEGYVDGFESDEDDM